MILTLNISVLIVEAAIGSIPQIDDKDLQYVEIWNEKGKALTFLLHYSILVYLINL